MLSQRLSPKELEFARQCVNNWKAVTGEELLTPFRFSMLFENHMQDLALGKLAEEHRTINGDEMGMLSVA